MPDWSEDLRYCSEELPWKHKTWTKRKTKVDGFQFLSRAFYNNVYDVLVRGGKLVVTPPQVRRQIAVMEQCRRQSPMPRMKAKLSKKWPR